MWSNWQVFLLFFLKHFFFFDKLTIVTNWQMDILTSFSTFLSIAIFFWDFFWQFTILTNWQMDNFYKLKNWQLRQIDKWTNWQMDKLTSFSSFLSQAILLRIFFFENFFFWEFVFSLFLTIYNSNKLASGQIDKFFFFSFSSNFVTNWQMDNFYKLTIIFIS